MSKKNYEIIEHTADIGIRVRGKSLKEVFKSSALAVFDILAERRPKCPGNKQVINIKQAADSRDELLVNWLNELLSLASAKEVVLTGVKINKLDGKLVIAAVTFEPALNFNINSEIKAATYHHLKLVKGPSGWLGEVILDV